MARTHRDVGGRTALSVLGLSLVMVTLVTAPAQARATARIGVDGCQGGPDSAMPGATIRIVACFESDGSFSDGDAVVIVENGPATPDAVVRTISPAGEVSFDLSSGQEGVSFVAACSLEVCSPSLRLDWSFDGRRIDQIEPSHPPLMAPDGSPTRLSPQVSGFGPVGSVAGERCEDGEPRGVPSFIGIQEHSVRELAHPKSGARVNAHVVTTHSPLLPGSVIYQAQTVVALKVRDPKGGGDRSAGPLKGAGRVLGFWSHGDSRIGKFEMAYDGGRWVDIPPSFTVLLSDNEVIFFPDDEEVRGTVVAMTRGEGLCDSIGTLLGGSDSKPDRRPAVAAGILTLLLMVALTISILRSSEPPSKGIVVDHPAGPPVSFERSDVTYDPMGRPLRFVDIVETPDGQIHTIRGTVTQETLVVEAPDLLDPSDWEDEVLVIERSDIGLDEQGRVSSFWEIITSSDGTSQRSHIRSISYDRDGRVARFEKAIEVAGLDGTLTFRTEVVDLMHDDLPVKSGVRPGLAAAERLHRTQLRYDDEGHITGAVCTTVTDGSASVQHATSGTPLEVPVPQPMWWAGLSFADVPVAASIPNRGLPRLRHVLTRWFRVHGCRVNVWVTDPQGKPMSDLPIRFGAHLTHLDRKGHQAFWVLREGNYSVTTVEGFLPGDQDGEGRYVGRGSIGWVCVNDVPGVAEARFTVSLPLHSRVGDQS